jgi:hypothetical protein
MRCQDDGGDIVLCPSRHNRFGRVTRRNPHDNRQTAFLHSPRDSTQVSLALSAQSFVEPELPEPWGRQQCPCRSSFDNSK